MSFGISKAWSLTILIAFGCGMVVGGLIVTIWR